VTAGLKPCAAQKLSLEKLPVALVGITERFYKSHFGNRFL